MDTNATTTKSLPELASNSKLEDLNTNFLLKIHYNFQSSVSPTTRVSSTVQFNWQHFYSLDAICFQNFQETGQHNSTLSTIAIDQATSSEIWYYFSQFNPSTLLRSNATTAMQPIFQTKPEASNDNRANKLQQPYMQILYGANYLLGLPNFWKW